MDISILWVIYTFTIILQTYIESKCQNLNNFVTKMKDRYWNDWDKSIELSRSLLKSELLVEEKQG